MVPFCFSDISLTGSPIGTLVLLASTAAFVLYLKLKIGVNRGHTQRGQEVESVTSEEFINFISASKTQGSFQALATVALYAAVNNPGEKRTQLLIDAVKKTAIPAAAA